MVLSQIFSQHVFINNFNFQINFFGVALHASDGPIACSMPDRGNQMYFASIIITKIFLTNPTAEKYKRTAINPRAYIFEG